MLASAATLAMTPLHSATACCTGGIGCEAVALGCEAGSMRCNTAAAPTTSTAVDS